MTGRTPTRKPSIHRGLMVSILGVLSTASSLSAEIDRARWLNNDNYMLLMSHMPDFDQRRGGPNGLMTNLNANGATHCGPTSCANLLAYISTHGFPLVDPTQADYANTGHAVLYNRVTELIRDLGVEMNVDTSAAGTFPIDRSNAMRARLQEQFTVASFTRSPDLSWWPSLDRMARAGINNGAIMSLCYGFWNWGGDAEDGVILSRRNGGHVVTLAAAAASGGIGLEHSMWLGACNPWTGNEESNRTQSAFEVDLWDVEALPLFDINGELTTAHFLTDDDAASFDGRSDRVLETYMSIQPRAGLSWDSYDDSFFLLGPNVGTWSDLIDPIRSSGPTRSRIRDLQYDPDMLDAILLGEDDRCLLRFPVGSDHPRRIKLPYDDGKIDAFSIDRHRNLLVFSDRSVRRYDVDGPCDPDFEGTIPAPATAVHVNDARDETLVLMGGIAALGRFTGLHTNAPAMTVSRLPRGLDWKRATGLIQFDDGMIMVCMNDGTVFKLEERGRSIRVKEVRFEGIARNTATSISVDDLGFLLVAAGGKVHAFTHLKLDDRFVLDSDHLFHGQACGDRFVPSRSRSNQDAEEPGFKNEMIGDRSSTRTIKRCRGDVNWDQRVDEADVTQIFSAVGETRGAEDLNRDGIVNILDIVIATSNFGACD